MSQATAANFKNTYGFTYPMLADPSNVAYSLYYQGGYVPVNTVIDQNFVVQYADAGWGGAIEDEIIELLDELTIPDEDGDGYRANVDCDDDNAAIHPCANEILDNAIDEDCSGSDRSIGAGEINEQESNDDAASAQDVGTMTEPITVIGNICEASNNAAWYEGDVDFYRFRTPAAKVEPTVSFVLSWTGTANYDLWLYQSNGTTPILYSTSILNPETMTASLASDTEYVLMAAGWSGAALDYTLTIEEYVCWDDDGDQYDDIACGGDDCDDADYAVNPGATEGPIGDPTCSDGIDNDCDGLIDVDEGLNCVEGGSSLAFGPESTSRTLGHIGLILIPLVFVLGWRRRLN